jgi:hypothetical protein
VDFWTVKDIDQLKRLGKYPAVRAVYVREINPRYKERSWKTLWEDLQKQDPYFRSVEHRLTFALLELDGTYRSKILGLDKRHSIDKNLLKKWYDAKVLLIHPDKNPVAYRAKEAFNLLVSIYKGMK